MVLQSGASFSWSWHLKMQLLKEASGSTGG